MSAKRPHIPLLRFKDLDDLIVIWRELYDLGYTRNYSSHTLNGGIESLRRSVATNPKRIYLKIRDNEIALVTEFETTHDAFTPYVRLNSCAHLLTYLRLNTKVPTPRAPQTIST